MYRSTADMTWYQVLALRLPNFEYLSGI